MKITVINGSPRKKWNTSQVLNQFMDGMRSTDSSLEIKEIHVYDYNYTGCRSCFACQMKRFEGNPVKRIQFPALQGEYNVRTVSNKTE
jgi:multimeric flavodoxin WrbA